MLDGLLGSVFDGLFGGSTSKGEKEFQKAGKLQGMYLSSLQSEKQAWNAMFGDMYQNINDSISSLTGESFASPYIQQTQKQFQDASTQARQEIERMGLGNSGASIAVGTDLGIKNAQSQGMARQQGEQQAMQAKQNWMSVALQQKSDIDNRYANAVGGQVNQYNAQGNYFTQKGANNTNTVLAGAGAVVGAFTGTPVPSGAVKANQNPNNPGGS